MSKLNDYEGLAALARRNAGITSNPYLRAKWLKIAAQWEYLAGQVRAFGFNLQAILRGSIYDD